MCLYWCAVSQLAGGQVASSTAAVHLLRQGRPVGISQLFFPLTRLACWPYLCLQFDYIIGMDASNLAAIRRAAEYWRQNGDAGTVPADYASKLSLMTDYLRDAKYSRKYKEVPDRECSSCEYGMFGGRERVWLGSCAGCLPATSTHASWLLAMSAPHTLHLPPPCCAAYYGGASGFELVLDLLDDACEGLLGRVNRQ